MWTTRDDIKRSETRGNLNLFRSFDMCTLCDMIWYDIMWHDMIWYDRIGYYVIWHDIILSHMIWYYVILYDMLWYDMILYDKKKF